MGTGRWLVAGVVFAVACAGKSTSGGSDVGSPSDAGGEPPGTECKPSFPCPTGEHCDDGTCVPDDCPGAGDPVLLLEAPPGSPWGTSGNHLYLTALDGRDYLVLVETDASGRSTGPTRFLDVQTVRESVLVHDPAYVSCAGSPPRCSFFSESSRTFAEIDFGDDIVTVREDTLFDFSGYDYLSSSDADHRDGHVVVSGGGLVALYDRFDSAPITSIDLEDKSLLNILIGADGRAERVLSWRQANAATGESGEVSVTPLETGAEGRPIYSGPGGKLNAPIPLPAGEEWFVLIDQGFAQPAVSVYRTDESVTLVGAVDPLWAIDVDPEYRTARRPLEPGPSAYVRHCDENGCGSFLFSFDPVGLEEVGRVMLPEPNLRTSFSRAIACGGADFWVVTSTGDGAPFRYWSMRVAGRAGFP